MSEGRTLLVELFTEELPPKALPRLEAAFAGELHKSLVAQGFVGADAPFTAYATPRRLAVTIANVAARSADKPFKQKLLPVSVGYDASGNPTQALARKLAALGLAPDVPLVRQMDRKAEALFHEGIAPGVALAQGLGEALAQAIAALPIPKVMSYASPGDYYNNEKFVRPAHRLVALHGADVVPVKALGLAAGRTTQGHRFLSRGTIDIATAEAYAPTLEAEGKVIPSFEKRKATIRVALEGAAGDATPIMPEALLDEVTALVEWPVVYAGTFEEAFLAVPQECLILTMQLNQRYFALADDAGKLGNRFLLVSNLATDDPSAIVAGNERVLRARLADARFFYDQDRRQRLDARLPKLASVVYHHKLGSQGERVMRLAAIAQAIAPAVGADPAIAGRAAMLAKADLVTDMVGEFPELQGTMGRYYARHDGELPEVGDAIAQHYWPRYAGDALPEGPVAQAVALADKLEALAGLFGVGQTPTGDKDPFGLRRAALGVVRILVERKPALPLVDAIGVAFAAFRGVPAVKPAAAELEAFVLDRLRGYLREQGGTANQVEALIARAPATLASLPERLAAVQAFEALPEAAALAAANKRIVNILRKSGAEAAAAVDRSLLAEGAEHDLYLAFQTLVPAVDASCDAGDYAAALEALATAKPAVDRYFDDVMVMADDPAVRANRLALPSGVAATMNRVADISKF